MTPPAVNPFDSDEDAPELYGALTAAIALADRAGENRYVLHCDGEFRVADLPPARPGLFLVCIPFDQPVLARIGPDGECEMLEHPHSADAERQLRAHLRIRATAAHASGDSAPLAG